MVTLLLVPSGNSVGTDLLDQSIQLSQDTADAWEGLWQDILDPSNGLWLGLSRFGLTLAALSIIYVGFKIFYETTEGKTWFGEFKTSLIWAIAIAFLLSGNAPLLANMTLLTRDVANYEIRQVLDVQLTTLTLRDALQEVALTSAAQDQIEALLAQCQSLTVEYSDCVQEQQPAIDQIISDAESSSGITLPDLRQWAQNQLLNLASTPLATQYTILKVIFYALQWAFVNLIEASLLLTATLAPLAVGASLLPIGTRAIWAWYTSYLGLFLVQLCYNILIGVSAVIAVSTNVNFINELNYLAFIAIFAPILAVALGSGGGKALFQAASGAAAGAVQLATDVATGFATGGMRLLKK